MDSFGQRRRSFRLNAMLFDRSWFPSSHYSEAHPSPTQTDSRFICLHICSACLLYRIRMRAPISRFTPSIPPFIYNDYLDEHCTVKIFSIMSKTAICLKPINDLLKENFHVPSYQRGYRWTARQVEELLNDIWEFQSKCESEDKARFYCLQPIVVQKRPNGDWELVDGQQRLTTILLFLTYLSSILEILGKSRFSITFDTRSETSGAFLQNIDLSKRDDNIDYHHICNAFDAIEKWFSVRDGNHKLKFLQSLLNDDELGRNVKVIWYELPGTEDPISAFTRLNVGKIPLTNAELIRALFLRSGNFEPGTMTLQQLKIAQEWDGIEKVLQSDEVWYFLHRGINSPASRIEYVFQLIAREEAGQTGLIDDPYSTFHFYNEKFNAASTKATTEWLTVKQYFMTLEEWYNDHILYNLIGFLIHDGDDLLAIRKAGRIIAKSAFHRILKQRIFKRLFGSELSISINREELNVFIENKLDDLEYGPHSDKIRAFLLLFNIATLLQNDKSKLRFPFELFKKENWDIEHVRSVESGKPSRPDTQRQWLEKVRDYLAESGENLSLLEGVRSLLGSDKLDGELFNDLYSKLLEHFKEANDTEIDNGIGNLTLLDATTNRSYKNAVFPVKRQRILGLDRAGTFVPLCTKNVFLKCYSRKINNMMFWSEEDMKNYREVIIQTLVDFFSTEKGGSQ